jgi:hypothetical protein
MIPPKKIMKERVGGGKLLGPVYEGKAIFRNIPKRIKEITNHLIPDERH